MVAALDVVDEGADDRPVAAVTMTSAVLDPGDMDLRFARPVVIPMAPPDPEARPPEEFFCIEPGTRAGDHGWSWPTGSATRGASSTAGRWPCWPTWPRAERWRPETAVPTGPVAAADTVLHYLRPVKVGPVEARCQVLGVRPGRTVVRVAIHDVGADGRLTTVGTVAVLDV